MIRISVSPPLRLSGSPPLLPSASRLLSLSSSPPFRPSASPPLCLRHYNPLLSLLYRNKIKTPLRSSRPPNNPQPRILVGVSGRGRRAPDPRSKTPTFNRQSSERNSDRGGRAPNTPITTMENSAAYPISRKAETAAALSKAERYSPARLRPVPTCGHIASGQQGVGSSPSLAGRSDRRCRVVDCLTLLRREMRDRTGDNVASAARPLSGRG